LRYISSTNHSFCPNGDGELTAATRLDSFASGKRFSYTLATHISAVRGYPLFRP